MKRITAAQRQAHQPTFSRRLLGHKPIGRGSYYGWSVRCECGWRLTTNEDRTYVNRRWREHVLEAPHETDTKVGG